MEIKIMVACRGTDRHRVLASGPGMEKYPWRKTILVDRGSGEVRVTGPMEKWLALPKLKQIRKTGPAKISLTVFGYFRERHGNEANMMRSAEPKVAESDIPSPV